MKYRKLDSSGDMVFGHGLNDYLQDTPETVAQSVLTRLKLWRNEWYLNTDDGTPYMQDVLGTNTKQSAIRAIQQRVLDSPGVTKITAFEYTQSGRHAKFMLTIETIYGEATVNG